MIGRILTISTLLLGLTGMMSSAQADQNSLPVDCQYSCSCQECCASKGINCEPYASKSSSLQPGETQAPVSNVGNAGEAR